MLLRGRRRWRAVTAAFFFLSERFQKYLGM
jgi:hypothetical protein